MQGRFLADLVRRFSLRLDLEHFEYLCGRGASEDQIDGLSLGSVFGAFTPTNDPDQVAFKKWSWGLKRIRDHISYPLTDQAGDVVGVLTGDHIEKNYSKFTMSHATSTAFLFGLPLAIQSIWDTKVVWLVEGVFDWFPLQRVIPNTVAITFDSPGWKQIQFVKRYADVVVLAIDQDEAGKKGVEIAKKRFGPDFDVRVAQYPGKDPGEFWADRGEMDFKRHFQREAGRLGVAI